MVKLPNLSPTMEAGTIVAWEKQEGERIEEGEVLAIIETDKSTMEMETPEEGYVAKIFLPAGSKDVPVNQVDIYVIFLDLVNYIRFRLLMIENSDGVLRI